MEEGEQKWKERAEKRTNRGRVVETSRKRMYVIQIDKKSDTNID